MEKIIPFPDFSDNNHVIQIVDYLDTNEENLNLVGSSLYYKYPIFKEYNQNSVHPDLFIVSPSYGLLLIKVCDLGKRLLDDKTFKEQLDTLDELYGQILSKLIKIPSLKQRKARNQINIPINTFLYIPNAPLENFTSEDSFIFNKVEQLENILSQEIEEADNITTENLTDIYSIIDGTRAIPKISKRDLTNEDYEKKGGILEKLDTQIATFDQKQRLAALTIVDGPQRIRGMAGSGKTVVLAMKAALIHLDDPSAKILFTFYTKSLYSQIKQLITRFYRMQQDHDPDWNNIHILHAWGGKNLPGVYFNTCIDNGITPLNFTSAKYEAKRHGMDNFEYTCYDLLEKTSGKITKKYDYVLMDEGQDFPKTYYWLCRKLVRNDRITWAYDELQNILDIEIQETKELFNNNFGDSGIDLSALMKNHPYQNNDIVLHTSYRNPLEILITAQALGFGIYSDKMVQMLENKDHWEDLGYIVKSGTFTEGSQTIIERPKENSPSIISDLYTQDEIIDTQLFQSFDEEIEFVIDEIKKAIDDKLLPEDIMVICMDDRYARSYFERISKGLSAYNIYTNNTLTSYSGEIFTTEGQVTLTTVYRGKGNESGMVFVIGIDSLQDGKYDILSRNKLFTAFTRSKAWLKITGVTSSTTYINSEIKTAKSFIPKLEFTYPSVSEIKTLRRQITKESADLNKKREKLLKQLDIIGLDENTALELLKGERKL
ncbi:hypothetical protein IGK15_001618 [Enterococcus sp. AZ045]|uniref:DEAD/DEAH box helicase n=1 Tax=Enterococcus sp. AZ045 TaxID=2774807 RepID=UPI003F23DB54